MLSALDSSWELFYFKVFSLFCDGSFKIVQLHLQTILILLSLLNQLVQVVVPNRPLRDEVLRTQRVVGAIDSLN